MIMLRHKLAFAGMLALLAACGGEEDWSETPVSAQDMPFSYAGDELDRAPALERARNSRTGTTIQTAIYADGPGFAVFRHYSSGNGRFYDMADPKQWTDGFEPASMTFNVSESYNTRIGTQNAFVEIVEPVEEQGCMRFVMPLQKATLLDNSAVTPYRTLMTGFYCRDGNEMAKAEVADILGNIKF